jgi:hypothetical protein
MVVPTVGKRERQKAVHSADRSAAQTDEVKAARTAGTTADATAQQRAATTAVPKAVH